MVCHRNPGTGRRRALLVTLFSVMLLLPTGRVCAESETERLSVELSDAVPSPGDRLTLEIVVPSAADSRDIEILGLELPELIAPDPNTVIETGLSLPGVGSMGRAARIRIEAQAAQPGRAVLESFEIRAGHDTFRTDPQLIEVSVPGSSSDVPYSVVWRVPRDEHYRNEVIPISLLIENSREYVFPESLNVPSPADAEFVEVQASEEIERRDIGERTLYTIPVARYLFFADAAGTVELPQAEINAAGFQRLTPVKELELQELPEEVRTSNAVGTFEYSVTLDRDQISGGEGAVVALRVSGEGNLPFLQIPAIVSDDLVVTRLEEKEALEAAARGYAGWRELTYRVTPRSTGRHSIQPPEFVWFDPRTGTTRRTVPPSLVLEVAEIETAAGGPPGGDKELQPFDVDTIRRIEPANYYRRQGTYLWLLPGIIVVLLGVLGVLPGRALAVAPALIVLAAAAASESFPEDAVARGLEAYNEGRYADAAAGFEAALLQRPESPGLLYNAALALYQQGETPEALYRLRCALRANPTAAGIGEALSRIESELGLEQQPEPPRLPHPDIFVISALVLVNLLCILVVMSKNLRAGPVVIIVVFGVLLTAASIGFAVYSARASSMPVAVVGPDSGVLRRIPDSGADAWLRLEPGTAVKVLVRHLDFQLVRTGYGVEGWLSGDAVIGTIGKLPPVRSSRE